MKVVFFGDSLTDMCRSRDEKVDKVFSYGNGYVFQVATLLMKYDSQCIETINVGCGGDRTTELLKRYETDVVAKNPDVLSIMIGVNDVWHHVINNGNSYRKYLSNYRELLKNLKEKLPNTKIMVCEPFFIKGPATEGNLELFSLVYKYAKGAKKLAKEFNCHFVKLQSELDKAAAKYGNTYVLYDGVHSNLIGADVIANKWFKEFKKVI